MPCQFIVYGGPVFGKNFSLISSKRETKLSRLYKDRKSKQRCRVFPVWRYKGAPTAAIDEQFPINRANTIKENWTPSRDWLLASVFGFVGLQVVSQFADEVPQCAWVKCANVAQKQLPQQQQQQHPSLLKQLRRKSQKRINEKCKTNNEKEKIPSFFGHFISLEGQHGPFFFGASMKCKCSAAYQRIYWPKMLSR